MKQLIEFKFNSLLSDCINYQHFRTKKFRTIKFSDMIIANVRIFWTKIWTKSKIFTIVRIRSTIWKIIEKYIILVEFNSFIAKYIFDEAEYLAWNKVFDLDIWSWTSIFRDVYASILIIEKTRTNHLYYVFYF